MKVLNFLAVAGFFILASCVRVDDKGNVVNAAAADSVQQEKKASWIREDEFYTIYSAKNFNLNLRSKRPSPSDASLHFCIAAAFTRLENDSIDGLFIEKGRIINRKVNRGLGGGLLINGDSVSIFKTNEGKLLTEKWRDSVAATGASFFQQIQLVRNGEALPFHKDVKLFERRAVVIFKSGEVAVVESKNRITLDEFAGDLVKMGAKDAIYTDMGSWDEGWYRDAKTGKKVVIGRNRSETGRQSSWVVFGR